MRQYLSRKETNRAPCAGYVACDFRLLNSNARCRGPPGEVEVAHCGIQAATRNKYQSGPYRFPRRAPAKVQLRAADPWLARFAAWPVPAEGLAVIGDTASRWSRNVAAANAATAGRFANSANIVTSA